MTANEYSYMLIELDKKKIFEQLCENLNSLIDYPQFNCKQMKKTNEFVNLFNNSEKSKNLNLYLKCKNIIEKSKNIRQKIIETLKTRFEKYTFLKLKGKKEKIKKKTMKR